MIINVKAKPNSRENKIEEKEGAYHISLKEPAEKNRANLALIKLVAKHFNKTPADVRILRGKQSSRKVVEIK